ncbi:hypothetical protein E2320_022719 [Naja naja]|nr:hypothetical protein E2320_022719 [Naja naja]
MWVYLTSSVNGRCLELLVVLHLRYRWPLNGLIGRANRRIASFHLHVVIITDLNHLGILNDELGTQHCVWRTHRGQERLGRLIEPQFHEGRCRRREHLSLIACLGLHP